ncbi:putative undecaprenyl diphosphate synthase-domain-containing protein [Russula aff. rugulosa BPL654]|nr:putative undecaprenyl diphosphate synthase-domain-containing protein [Russula aff. rugulosa BPL654]
MMPTAPLDAAADDHVHATSAVKRVKTRPQPRSRSVAPPPIMSLLQYASRLRDNTIDRIRRVLLGILKTGPIPHHVAFIMDGNRRYARDKGVKVIQGHVDGFAALRRILGICSSLDIKVVSVYAFSIDNFKRPQEEVDGLMNLAEKALLELCTHGGLLAEHGVRLNTIGKTQLFPPAVQAALAEAKELTKNNNRAVLNMCMPYSSRDEITTAVEETVHDALVEGRIEPITESDIEDRLLTAKVNSPPLDVLIRTSGVKRLSDYLLWQCTENTQIHFIDTYWPDIGLLDLLPIILDYQRKVWSQ